MSRFLVLLMLHYGVTRLLIFVSKVFEKTPRDIESIHTQKEVQMNTEVRILVVSFAGIVNTTKEYSYTPKYIVD